MSGTAPFQELVASGLHCLAQPLTAGLWLVESAEMTGSDDVFVQQMSSELRRATAVLRFLRAAVEQHSAMGEGEIALGPWLRSHATRWRQMLGHAGVHLRMEARTHVKLVCNGPVLAAAFEALLAQLSQIAQPGATATITGTRSGLSFRFENPEPLTAEQQVELSAAMDPFEQPRFNFAGAQVTDGLIARGMFAVCGLRMTAAVEAKCLTLRMEQPPAAAEEAA